MIEKNINIETNSGKEFNITVFYEEIQAEDRIYYYADGAGYPGQQESIDIIRIEFQGKDVTDLNWDFNRIENVLK
jgi:uncharacterized heparinase superfamily protein